MRRLRVGSKPVCTSLAFFRASVSSTMVCLMRTLCHNIGLHYFGCPPPRLLKESFPSVTDLDLGSLDLDRLPDTLATWPALRTLHATVDCFPTAISPSQFLGMTRSALPCCTALDLALGSSVDEEDSIALMVDAAPLLTGLNVVHTSIQA